MSERNNVDQGVPRVELREPESTELALLRSLQRALLTHPVASQAAFTALVAEGRRFATTEEGRVWQERLVQSALLKRARLVFDLTTLGLLEERAGNDVPSSYLDALFMAAASGDADDLLNRLFWTSEERSVRGQPGN